ncbi:MAG TPA: hypothetical protein VFQ38_13245 [Longimicrobiales bacterium]|nr:hypothetical protein [Longimicrobiales bacterium]
MMIIETIQILALVLTLSALGARVASHTTTIRRGLGRDRRGATQRSAR